MKGEKYTCAYCHNTYEKGWSDEEANKEAEINFGKHPKDWNDEQVVICDDCYTLMFPPMHKELVEIAKKKI